MHLRTVLSPKPWRSLGGKRLQSPTLLRSRFLRNKLIRATPLGAAALGALALSASLGATELIQGALSDEIRWQPYTGTALDGSPLPGELGYLNVPENHQQEAAAETLETATLEIAFVRYRTSHPNPRPPIFFLAGGPGGSGIEGATITASHPQIRLLEHSDVIGIDQRGTGRSLPDLTESPIEIQLPLDRAISRRQLLAATEQAARETVSYWRRQGVNLEVYNSEQSADDLDAVRRALGLEKIVLYGASYGSHLGLAYLRRHGEHVERAVLSKVEGPNHTFKLPSTVQKHLEHVHELVTGDPAVGDAMPDLLGTIERLLRQLEQSPVSAEEPPQEDEDDEAERDRDDAPPRPSGPVIVSPIDLQIELARALASSRAIAGIPAALHRFESGDWNALAATAKDNRRVSVYAMALMMDCSSGATAERWQRLKGEAEDPKNLLADAILSPFYGAACAGAGQPDLGDDFRRSFTSDVPVLFTSGTVDVRTPPENVEELLPGFPNAVHVVVENAGHQSRELMSPAYRDLLQSFLRGDSLESCRINLPEPIFEPIEAAAASK